MKTKFYFGRKNRRTNYRLYKRVVEHAEFIQNDNVYPIDRDDWYIADIPRGVFSGWNYCHQTPKDMKPIRPEEAEKYLFLHSL